MLWQLQLMSWGKGGGSQSWEHRVQVHRRQLESAEAAHQEPTTLSLTCRPAAGIGVIFLEVIQVSRSAEECCVAKAEESRGAPGGGSPDRVGSCYARERTPLRARTYQQVCKHVGGTRWERRGAISTCGKRTECMHEMFLFAPIPFVLGRRSGEATV